MTVRKAATDGRWRRRAATVLLVALTGVLLFGATSGTAAAATTVTECTTVNASNAPADGRVVLGGDVTDGSASSCIRIRTSDVTLDGDGYTIDGTGSGTAIEVASSDGARLSNVTVRNLATSDWGRSVSLTRVDDATVTDARTAPDTGSVSLDAVADATVRNVSATGASSSTRGIMYAAGSDRVSFENVTITDFGGRALATSGGSAVSVLDSDIRDSTSAQYGIRITSDGGDVERNTLSNLTRGTSLSTGIEIQSDDVDVRNNTVTDVDSGINSFNNDRGAIADNVLRRAGTGLYVAGQNHSVTDNVVTDGQRGLALGRGTDARPGTYRNVVRNNTVAGNAVNFNPSPFDPARVDASNTVEGDPIRSFTDTSGVTIDGSQPAGYVYAYNVSGLAVSDLVLDNGSVTVSKSTDVTASNVTAFGDGESVLLYDTDGARITGLDADAWEGAVRVESSSNVTVDNATLAVTPNSAYRSQGYGTVGLFATGSSSITVADTTIRDPDISRGIQLRVNDGAVVRNDVSVLSRGISLDTVTTGVTVSENTVETAGGTAISLERVLATTITDNELGANGRSIFAPTSTEGLEITGNNASANVRDGIVLGATADSLVANNTVADNGETGISLGGRTTAVRNNTVNRNGEYGIDLRYEINPSLNVVADNAVAENADVGIRVGSAGDTLRNNTVAGNQFGVHVDWSASFGTVEGGNVTMRDNALINNDQGLYVNPAVQAASVAGLDNDIDRSNTIDGKPIEYHYGVSDAVIDAADDPGYVGLVNVDNATVSGFDIAAGGQGVFLQNATDVSIVDGRITDTYNPVHVGFGSAAVTVENVTAERTTGPVTYDPPSSNFLFGAGFVVERVTDVRLVDSNVAGSRIGVVFNRDANTTVTGTSITGHRDAGLSFVFGGDDLLFYNNLLDNQVQTDLTLTSGTTPRANVSRRPGPNVLGGPEIGGNAYYSPDGTGHSQTCTDADSDGFCDSEWFLLGVATDSLPLATPALGTPRIGVSPTSLDFGDVAVGAGETIDVTVSNAGDAPLSISDVSLSGPDTGAFTVESAPDLVLAGQSGTVTVGFSPMSAGQRSASLDISSNDSSTGPVSVALAGNGTAVPTTGTIAGTVTNTTGAPLPGASITIENAGATVATLVADSNGEYDVEFPGNRLYTVRGSRVGYYDDATTAVVTNGTTTTADLVLAPDTVAPTAVITPFERTVSVGDPFGVEGTLSTDDTGIVAYEWAFGDGTTATGVTATHAYAGAGTYTVTLTVTDTAGNTNTTSVEVTATDTTPPVLTAPGAFDLTGGDGSVADGDEVRINVTATDDTGVASVTANASAFGAGTVTLTDPDGDGVYDATFTVGSTGSLAPDGVATITFTAVDVEGNGNTTTASLTIDTSTSTPTPTDDDGATISPGQPGFGPGLAMLALLGAALLALRRH